MERGTAGLRELDDAIRASRDPKLPLPIPEEPLGFALEQEPFPDGQRAPIATVYLQNGECPLACAYCGLYRQTGDRPASGAEIARQIRRARERFPQARGLKLYNASSLFEPASIVQKDLPVIAASLEGLSFVVVEARSENAFRAVEFARHLAMPLEVAIGLEVADDTLLRQLNKPTSIAALRRAALALHGAGISLRAFVLVQPPFVDARKAVSLAVTSFELAKEEGARVVSLLPVFPTHRPLRLLAAAEFFAPPLLETLWKAVEACVGRGVTVLVETEFLGRLAACSNCGSARREALKTLNATGKLPAVLCRDHSPPREPGLRSFSKAEVLRALREGPPPFQGLP